MISSKDDPDYIFEEYKGYIIASRKSNIARKDINNLIIVYRSDEFPNYGLIVGLDDSKLSGERRVVPHNIDDAREYVDWELRCRADAPIDKEIKQTPYELRVNHGVLPTVDIKGHTFYVDIRMNKLRPKDDFLSKGISFAEIDHYYDDFKKKYVIPYDFNKREFREIDFANITKIPKDLIVIQFPHESMLDPVGWNRRGGYEAMDGLKPNNIKIHFIAKQGKWNSFGLSEIIEDNLKSKAKIDIAEDFDDKKTDKFKRKL